MNMMGPPPPSDCGAVAAAAEALGIGEYDFFRLAFRRWSGREPQGKALEGIFVAYMFHQRVPPCVRHLGREVLKLKGSGALDPAAFGLAAFERRQPLPRLGRFSWRLAAGAMVVLFLMSLDVSYMRDRSIPLGCPGATGSMFFDRLGAFFGGAPERACPDFAYPGTEDAREP